MGMVCQGVSASVGHDPSPRKLVTAQIHCNNDL